MKGRSGNVLAAMAFVVVAPLLQSCSDDTSATETAPFTRISSGSYSAIQTKTLTVYTNQADFEAAYYADSALTLPAPTIDFEQTLVIGAFMGEQPDSGKRIEINSIVSDDEKLEISVKLLEPEGGCSTQPVVTYPYELVSIAKPTGKQILFVESLGKRPCASS